MMVIHYHRTAAPLPMTNPSKVFLPATQRQVEPNQVTWGIFWWWQKPPLEHLISVDIWLLNGNKELSVAL